MRYPFESPEAQLLNKQIFETIYYGALEASCDLAKEHGPYETYEGSPVSKGVSIWIKFSFFHSVGHPSYVLLGMVCVFAPPSIGCLLHLSYSPPTHGSVCMSLTLWSVSDQEEGGQIASLWDIMGATVAHMACKCDAFVHGQKTSIRLGKIFACEFL